MSRKWWQPENPKPGLMGVFHAVMNIVTESTRFVMVGIGINMQAGDRDLAYWVAHIAVWGLSGWAVIEILGAMQI